MLLGLLQNTSCPKTYPAWLINIHMAICVRNMKSSVDFIVIIYIYIYINPQDLLYKEHALNLDSLKEWIWGNGYQP